MALCSAPVASSPSTAIRPDEDSVPNLVGMLPVVLKKLISAVATLVSLTVSGAKFGDGGRLSVRSRNAWALS